MTSGMGSLGLNSGSGALGGIGSSAGSVGTAFKSQGTIGVGAFGSMGGAAAGSFLQNDLNMNDPASLRRRIAELE